MAGPGWYFFGDDERAEVERVLESQHLTRYRFGDAESGTKSMTMQLEEALADVLHVRHVVAMNSGTSALLAGLRALGIGTGDEVIVPGYTFIASIAAIIHSGAIPVLAEVDASLTIDPDDVESKLTPQTSAIMPVHMIGACADMSRVVSVAQENGCSIIEDAAQACGGTLKGKAYGTYGDIGAFSLNVGKTITTGDGGFLVTDDDELYRRAYSFHDHGFLPNRAGVAHHGPLLGLNFRMNEIAAAVGVAQVRKLSDILERCRKSKSLVRSVLSDLAGAVERPLIDSNGECATTFILTFDDEGRADRVATALQGHPLGASTYHNYATMTQLSSLAAVDNARIRFGRPGDLPQTDSLLRRSVAMSVGLVDEYLGTMGDIIITDDDETILYKAERLRELIEATE